MLLSFCSDRRHSDDDRAAARGVGGREHEHGRPADDGRGREGPQESSRRHGRRPGKP